MVFLKTMLISLNLSIDQGKKTNSGSMGSIKMHLFRLMILRLVLNYPYMN